MSELNMKQFLENVISGKSNRRFATMDGKNSVHIPLLVRSKQPKTLFMYSTNYNDIAASDKNNTNPVRIQLQNLVKGAMIYSVFQQLGKDEPLAQRLNSSINAFFNGKGNQKRFSSELETEVNEAWRKAIESDESNLITKNARLMIDTAIEEMNAGGDLKAAKVSISDAKSAADLFVKSFEANIMHSANTPLTRNNEISAMFSNTGEKVQEFLNQRFGSTFDQHYLRMLLADNANALQHLGDKINIDMSVIAEDIPFRQENESQSPSNSIPSAVYRKARVNKKKGVRGKISAYIKRDESFGEYGISHLIVNVTEHDGAEHVNYNEFLFSHTSDPLDGSSTNELTAYLKTENEIQPYFTTERAQQYLEEEKLSAERRAAFEAQVIEENAAKRAEAFSVYNTHQDVTNAGQLEDTYFGKANVAELAVKYIHGLKVSPEGNVWLPLANVIENKPVEENIEAFQELLAQTPEWSSTNKLFQGLGDGYKHKCSVTLGDPKTASIIGTSEGVKNGLIQMEMAKQRGINLAMVCALDVGNLTSAVKKIIDEHPTKPVVNFADNDLFNSDKQRRFLRHELEAQGIEPNGKNTNIGMDKAIEIHQAVNLPYIAYDFERDIAGMNLLDIQQSQKGSDIDDLLHAVQHELASNGVENSHQEAWNRVTDLFESKIESTMKFSVSPHWTKERQNDFGWCPSLENLSEQRLPNYYHMKESIGHAQEVFQKNFGMSYDVYQSMVQTQHWSPSSEEMASMIVADSTINQYEDAITQHIDNIENGVVEVNENSIESEPMTELDAQFGSLVSPTIDEQVSKVDAKIVAITRRINNLEQNMDKYPIAKFEERMQSNSTELNRLYDEKARLLGVSANQVKQERSINKYYDRSITEANDPLVINQDKEDLQFESLENAQSVDATGVDSQSLLNDVFKQVYDNEDNPSNNNQGVVELLHTWAETQTSELDALLETPHSDVNKQYSAFRNGVVELEQHLTGIEDNTEGLVAGSLKSSADYSKYFLHLEELKQRADETLDVHFDDQARAAIDTINIQAEPDWIPHENSWANEVMMDASHHELEMNQELESQGQDTDYFEHFLNSEQAPEQDIVEPVEATPSEPEHTEAAAPEHDTAEPAEAPQSEPEHSEAAAPEHDTAEPTEAPQNEPEHLEAAAPEHDTAEPAEAPQNEPEHTEAAAPEHDTAEPAEAPQNEPEHTEAAAPEHDTVEPAEAPQNEPEHLEAAAPEHDTVEPAEAPQNEPEHLEAAAPEHDTVEPAEAPQNEPEHLEAAAPKHETAEPAEAPQKTGSAERRPESIELKLVAELVEGIIESMNKSHQQTLDKMMEMTSSVFNQQSQLLEQISKLTIQVDELTKQVNGQSYAPVTSNEMNIEEQSSEIQVNDTPDVNVDSEREQLINDTLELANEVMQTKATTSQIRDRILEASKEPVKPSDLANVMQGAQSSEKNNSPELANSYEQNVALLQQSAEALRDASYRRVDPQLKVVMHDAISSKGKVTLEEISNNANKQGGIIKGVLKDVFGNGEYRKGLPIAIAISECMRNCEDPAIPPSAISTYVFTEMTGKKDNPLAGISEKVVKGEIKTSQYFNEARMILGDSTFEEQLGDEYAEMFNRLQEQVPEYEREIDHQAPPLNYDIPSPV